MSTINLLPDDYVARRRQRRTNFIGLVLFVAVLAGVVGAYVVSERTLSRALAVRDQVDAEYADAARLIEQMQRLQARRGQLLTKAKRAAALQERAPRSFVLAVLTNARPEYTSLTSVRVELAEPGGAKFEAARRRRTGVAPEWAVHVRVSGLASTDVEVAKFIANLARCELVDTVDLNFSREKKVDKVLTCRQFELKLELKRGLDVLDLIQQDRAEPDASGDRAAGRNPRPAPAAEGGPA